MFKKKKKEIPIEEKRKYKRVKKSFVLRYYVKNDKKSKHEITQLKNISQGGMCFVTTEAHPPDTKIKIELKTPYLSDLTLLDGTILGSHENVKNLIYETRVEFEFLDQDSAFIMDKLKEIFITGDNKFNE